MVAKFIPPDAATQSILRAAVQEAQAQFIEGLTSYSQPWWPDRKWSPPDPRGVKTGFTYQTADALDVDARGFANYAAFALPKKTGKSLVYLFTFRDSRGERLSGERTYTLRVPANVPARQYWSMMVYDVHTAAFIREAPVITLDSYNQAMKRNADGSVDIYFGAKAPAGEEGNWTQRVTSLRDWVHNWRIRLLSLRMSAPATWRATSPPMACTILSFCIKGNF